MTEKSPELLTHSEASKELRLHPITLRKACAAGLIGCYRFGRRVFYGRHHIKEYMQRNERHPVKKLKRGGQPGVLPGER